MPQRVSQQPTVLFNKGLNTEAGELSFPEGASVDELNMSLERSGSRRRRLGVAYEENYELDLAHNQEDIVSTHLWENAGGVAGLTFVVVQLRNFLVFYRESEGALSSNKESFVVNLSSFNRPSGFGASTVEVQTTTLQGILIVASSEINTFRVDYDDGANTISTEEIVFRFRDFDWQGDTDTYYGEVRTSEITNARAYDTLNAGWKTDPNNEWDTAGIIDGENALQQYLDYTKTEWIGPVSRQRAPPLTHPWYMGINPSTGFFDVPTFRKVYAGTTLTANGSYILNLYDQDRQAVSGIPGLNSTETSRFKTVATYAGRVFYSGMSNKLGNRIYFSQILTANERLGDCFQTNDPTSEVVSDLLDTDGGYIQVNGAYNIRKLHVLGPFLIVMAENGIWVIRGVDDVFRASEYAVNKITEIGLDAIGSFVSADGRPYWWSKSGIHTLVANEQGSLEERNLSLDTVQTFWGNIQPSKRQQVKAAYDSFNQRVFWFYPSNTETTDHKLTKVLVFDEALRAFYPWSISEANIGQYILAPFFLKGNISSSIAFTVIDEDGNPIIDSLGNNVVVTKDSREYTTSEVTLLVRDHTSGNVTFAQFTDTDFLDWGFANYESYVEGGYDFTGDLTTKKSPIYVVPYFEITEEGLTGDAGTGYTLIRPSSCLVSGFWDFATTASSPTQQAYRLKDWSSHTATTFDYPRTVTVSRLRVRGRGRSYRLRFESEQGKDFHLLGFDSIVGKNPR